MSLKGPRRLVSQGVNVALVFSGPVHSPLMVIWLMAGGKIMCEANVYLFKEGKEELILEAVDIVEPDEEGKIRLANIFGEQKVLDAKLKSMSLVNHKIILE